MSKDQPMTMTLNKLLVKLVLLAMLVVSPLRAEQSFSVYTVNYPLAYFAERLAGEHVNVVFPAPAGIDPAFWKPDLTTIRAYQQADLILLNGAGYARWTANVSLPRLRSVDTSARFRDQLIRTQGGIAHSHGAGLEHSHAGTAFTTWLDLSLAAQQARAVAEALQHRLPQQRQIIEENYLALEKSLLALDEQLMELVRMNPGLPLLGSHPVYQYLAHRYGINLISLVWEPGEVPREEQWKLLEELGSTHGAKWMLWESEPLAKTVDRLRKMDIESVVIEPAGNHPVQGNYIGTMERNLANLKMVYERGS
ncbi:MAG: metal ABC transporter substrate-binding protein [Rhodothermales bacterium]